MLKLSPQVRVALTFAVTLAAIAVTQVHDASLRGALEGVLALGAAVGIVPAHLEAGDE